MNSILETLEIWCRHYGAVHRQNGDTTRQVKAAIKNNGLVVVANQHEAERIDNLIYRGKRSIRFDDTQKLMGQSKPIFWDAFALGCIFSAAGSEIRTLERRNVVLQKQRASAEAVADTQYRTQIESLEGQLAKAKRSTAYWKCRAKKK